jgi:hypothetical protein
MNNNNNTDDKINESAMDVETSHVVAQVTVPYCILGWRMKQQQAGDRPVMFSLLRRTINDDAKNDKWSREDQVSGRIEVDLVNKPLELTIVFDQDEEKWPGLRLPQAAKKGDRWVFRFVESPRNIRPRWRLLMQNAHLEYVELECDSWAFPDDWAETYFDPVYPPKEAKTDPLYYMYSGPIY